MATDAGAPGRVAAAPAAATPAPKEARARVVAVPILVAAAVVTAAAAVGAWTLSGGGTAGVHALLRATARVAVVFFALAFAARPAVTVTRGAPWAKALLANRRYLGISFGVAMGVHLVGIVLLILRVGPAEIGAATLVAGGLAYVLIAAMVATSADRTAAWLGRKRWRVLHSAGIYVFGTFFLLTYAAGPLAGRLEMIPFSVLVLTAWALRVRSFLRR